MQPIPEVIENGFESPLAASLERVLSLNLKERRPTMDQFFRWAAYIKRGPLNASTSQSPAQDIGCVHSVHLFRERKAPLHHEFALVSFTNGLGQYSWIRLERAARIKNRWLQADSFGPILSGAALRETVTVGAWKEELLSIESPVDEVAAVRMNDSLPSESKNGVVIDDFVEHLQTISKAKPEYQLFSANCRWFARRILLSTAQRLQSLGGPAKYRFLWKMKPVTYDLLFTKIQGDPFGGKQLEKSEGQIIKARSLIDLAANQRENSKYPEALASCDEALWILHAMSKDAIARQTTLIRAFSEMYRIRRDTNAHEEALIAIRQACTVLRVVCKDEQQAQSLIGILGSAMSNLSQAVQQSIGEEVRAKIQGALEAHDIWAELYASNPSFHHQSFVSSLFTVSEAYEGAGKETEAIHYSDEAVKVQRKTCLANAEQGVFPLDVALNAHAELLGRLNRTSEAYDCMKKRVSIHRTAIDTFIQLPIPVGAPSTFNTSRYTVFHSGLGKALLDQSKFALGLSLWKEAYLASRESAQILDDLHASLASSATPRLYVQSLSDALTFNGWTLLDLVTRGVAIEGSSLPETLHEGIQIAFRAVILCRENYTQWPVPSRFYERLTALGVLARFMALRDAHSSVDEYGGVVDHAVDEAMKEWRELQALESTIVDRIHLNFLNSRWTFSRVEEDLLSIAERRGTIQHQCR